ncbi:MAG TPA: hypothetical protein VFV49_04380 [Thermoanaerobaculia bacterium]|nr:hypothetical protein [Thermoanaerobaculia bacterium]
MNRGTPLAVLLCLMLASACAEEPPAARTFQVGHHRVDITPPAGWQVLDHGRQIVFRNEDAEMILSDLGAVRPEGFRDEVAKAKELWRGSRDDEARTRLWELPFRDELFVSRAQMERVRDPWSNLLSASRGTDYGNVAADFDRLFAAVDATQPAPLNRIVDDALPRLGHDQRREVKSREATEVAGREVMVVETWMTLTHADPRCLLVAVNAGRVLALRCDRCEGEAFDAFERLAASLQFPSIAPRK